MWKVRSSLAWRIARDFSRRSLGRLKSNTRWREGNPLPYSHLHQKELNVGRKEERPRTAKQGKANHPASSLQRDCWTKRAAHTLGEPCLLKGALLRASDSTVETIHKGHRTAATMGLPHKGPTNDFPEFPPDPEGPLSWVTFLVSSSMSQLFLILPQWHTRANRMEGGGH